MNIKQLEEPTPYEGSKSKFQEWRDQLHAYLSGHDATYVHLLLWIENLGRNVFRPEDIKQLQQDLDLTDSDIIESKNALYTMLSRYTAGPVKRAVRQKKVGGVFEQYRKIYYSGMKITPKNLFAEKAQVWKVNEVKIEEVDAAIDAWEAKLEFLEEHGRYTMEEEDKVHGLLEIVPVEMRVKLLEEQEKGKFVEYEDLKEEILYRVETQVENKGNKKLGWVGVEDEWDESWDDQEQRQDESEDWTGESWEQSGWIGAAYNPAKGTGKGKGGKGKDGKGKGKGKGDNGGKNNGGWKDPKGKGKGKGAGYDPKGGGRGKDGGKGGYFWNQEKVTGTFSGKIEFKGLCWGCGKEGHRQADCPDKEIVPVGNKRQRVEENPIAAALKDRLASTPAQSGSTGVPSHVANAVEQWRSTTSSGSLGRVSPMWINSVEKKEAEDSDGFKAPRKVVKRWGQGDAKRKSTAKARADESRFKCLMDLERGQDEELDCMEESVEARVPVKPEVRAARRRKKVSFAERGKCGCRGCEDDWMIDPSGSGSGLAPATDEPAESPLYHDEALRQGTMAKPQLAEKRRKAHGVNAFTRPSSIGAATQAQADGWTKVRVTVDSGAADSVASPETFPGYQVVEHAAPQYFQSATGEPIINMGEQVVAMVTEEGTLRGMKFQCTQKVKKPLASVKRMLEANHAVVFAPDELGGSFILNLVTGEMNKMHEADGNYMLDVWIPPASSVEGFGRHP